MLLVASAARRGRLSVCLVVFLLGWLPSCRSQDELRSIDLQYPMSFDLNELSGGYTSYGNDGVLTEGKFFYPLAQQDGKLFVGAKDELFSLDSATFEMNVSIPPSGDTSGCSSTSYCHNFVRLAQPLPDGELLVCSTNSLKPYCQTRSAGNLSHSSTTEAYTEFNTLPFVPHQNFSWLLLNDTVFAGANTVSSSDGTLRDPVVARADFVMNPVPKVTVDLRTKIDDTVLNGDAVQFVGDPIEYNGRIYFFFRETAIESVDNQVYSRVGVVCRNDEGGMDFSIFLDQRNLVTFVKARLECSLGGSSPYVYNEIQDTYQSTVNETVVFAIFATNPVGVTSSAVCAFRLDEIETLFLTGSKFYNKATRKEFDTDPVTPRQATCPDISDTNSQLEAILTNGQLMYNSVEDALFYDTEVTSKSLNPLLVSDGERYSQIVVDEDVLNSLDVMFIGTERGTVLKAYLNESRTEARVVEEIRLEPNVQTPVLSMLKSEDNQAVFVSTSLGVYRVPVQHCLDYPTRQECLDARDPYCSWNNTRCVKSTGDQDLEAGSGEEIEPAITFRQTPNDQRRVLNITNQPINLFLSAEVTPPGRNPRVRGDEIPCDQCASLPYTGATIRLADKELLVLYINGSSASETDICSCSCVVEMDGGVTDTANFTITVDNSAVRILETVERDQLETFDEEIRTYKDALNKWLAHVTDKLNLTEVRICPSSDGCP